jgi:alkylation response protein AidB-like acyl-CoA dehydrogenase
VPIRTLLPQKHFGYPYAKSVVLRRRKIARICWMSSIVDPVARPQHRTTLAQQQRQATQPLDIAQSLADEFATTAVERDRRGGTPKAERDALRSSGLLAMSIPRELGGLGAGWHDTLRAVRILARADSSIAHVFGFHHLMLATARLFGRPAQWEPWLEQTARHQWFWGNALNPLDDRTVATPRDGWHAFSGMKSFCSGALDSEMLIVSAMHAVTQDLLVAAVPTGRSGISVAPDWDSIGQRQTDSGSVVFEKVRVEQGDILADPGPLSTPFACLRPLIAQAVLTHVYVGIAENAFDDARRYTLHEARPRGAAQAVRQEDDPYVLAHYGDFWVGLESARVLADRAAGQLDAAWQRGDALTAAERAGVALGVATAKVAATRTGLDICTRMFDVTGARATHGGLGLDRHWRNLRTQTLHDPVDHKVREIGEWALKQQAPVPSFYS